MENILEAQAGAAASVSPRRGRPPLVGNPRTRNLQTMISPESYVLLCTAAAQRNVSMGHVLDDLIKSAEKAA